MAISFKPFEFCKGLVSTLSPPGDITPLILPSGISFHESMTSGAIVDAHKRRLSVHSLLIRLRPLLLLMLLTLEMPSCNCRLISAVDNDVDSATTTANNTIIIDILIMLQSQQSSTMNRGWWSSFYFYFYKVNAAAVRKVPLPSRIGDGELFERSTLGGRDVILRFFRSFKLKYQISRTFNIQLRTKKKRKTICVLDYGKNDISCTIVHCTIIIKVL